MIDAGSSWKSRVSHHFSEAGAARRWNDIYGGQTDAVEDRFFLERRDFVVDHVLRNCPEQAVILDLGCGAGPVTAPLREAGRSILALDYSADMLTLAKHRLVDAALDPFPMIQADSEYLPFGDASFDFIVCLGVVSYLPDYSKVLAEIFRVLRPGASVAISTRNSRNPVMSDPLRAAKRLLLDPRPASDEEFFPGRFLDPDKVEADLVASKFIVDSFEGIGFGPVRFRGRQMFGTGTSVRLNRFASSIARRVASGWLHRNFCDVNLWICRKPA